MIVTDRLCIRKRHPWTDWPKRPYEKIDTIVVHRNSIGYDADTVADWFEENPRWAGPRMPYHFVVKKCGDIEQALELQIRGNHALGRNRRSIGVGVIGDFREHKPTPEQLESLRYLLSALNKWTGGARIQRHGKPWRWRCPGEHINVEQLASEARAPEMLKNGAATVAAMRIRL